MITDWIYNNPTWLWRNYPGRVLHRKFHAVGCSSFIVWCTQECAKLTTILPASRLPSSACYMRFCSPFIAIATWESFNTASDIVENDSDYAGGIYLDTHGLPRAKGQPIRDAVARYVSVVINEEWPIQRAGKTPDKGWKPLRDLNTAIATIQPPKPW